MNNIGAEGFRWFVGVVEDVNDPEMTGRVRVRIYNVHSDNTSAVPTSQLPWASVLMPPTSASVLDSKSGNWVGTSPTGILVGSTVVGFFMDSTEANYPVIMGTLYGRTDDYSDVSPEARGSNHLYKNTVRYEPDTPYAAKYPYNKVYSTLSGHVVEIDDTPNSERIHVFHKSGTYIEINTDGRLVIKTVGENYEIVANNKIEYIAGNYTLNVEGDVIINGKTINLNNGTNGAARVGDTADTGDGGGAHADGSNKIESGSGTVFIGD